MDYQKDLNRYLKKYNDHFSDNVIEYGKLFVKRIKTNKLLKEYFIYNNISIYSFLLELLPISEYKFNSIGSEKLDENEINQIFGTVMLNSDILRLILEDKILISGINVYNEFVYELSDHAIYFFNNKYDIILNKIFSMRDLIILPSNSNNNNNKLLN